MFPLSNFYSHIFFMGSCTVLFNCILNYFNIKEEIFGKYTIGLTRSLLCSAISYSAYKKIFLISNDICLEKSDNLILYKEYNFMFLSYFVYDTIILFYQIYLNIEKKIRLDLLFHHLMGIFSLIMIDNYKLYNLSLFIGLSEGLSIVAGPKLLSVHFGNKYMKNIFVIYRLIYIFFIRFLLIWPSLLYNYHYITKNCDQYKENRNMYLVGGLLLMIINTEILWIFNGRKELENI